MFFRLYLHQHPQLTNLFFIARYQSKILFFKVLRFLGKIQSFFGSFVHHHVVFPIPYIRFTFLKHLSNLNNQYIKFIIILKQLSSQRLRQITVNKFQNSSFSFVLIVEVFCAIFCFFFIILDYIALFYFLSYLFYSNSSWISSTALSTSYISL